MSAQDRKVLVTIIEGDGDTSDSRLCMPRPSDERKNPMRCVIRNHIKEQFPWALNVTVGMKTIRLYDQRCKHNPEGKMGKCDKCVSKKLEFATPLSAARTIAAFDRGENPAFHPFTLRMDEAVVVEIKQDRLKKRAAMAAYNARVASGEHKPNTQSKKAKARAMSNRRKG